MTPLYRPQEFLEARTLETEEIINCYPIFNNPEAVTRYEAFRHVLPGALSDSLVQGSEELLALLSIGDLNLAKNGTTVEDFRACGLSVRFQITTVE